MVHAEFGKSHSKKLSNILVALSLVFFVGMTLAVHADGDFPSVAGFACGVKFTVTGYSGTSVLTNFPVLVRLSNNSPTGFRYDDFFRADGSDICFLDMEGNALAYDMDTWNIMGESLIWVSLPCMTNGTEFVMLYSSLSSGKSVCGDNAWADYTGVWHLGESGDGIVCVEDSSSNLLRANSSDWSQATTDGMIGSARLVADRCVKADKGIKVIETERAIGALNALDTDFSVSLWMRPQGSVTNKSNTGICYDALIGRKSSIASPAWQLQLAHNSTDMRIWASDTQDSSVTTTGRILPLEVGQWTKLDVVYSYSTSGDVAQYAVYANGILAECGNLASVPVQGESTLVIGGEPGSGERPFWGDMDEVRLRAFVPGPDWIKADYDTVCDTGFLTAGNVETYEELPRPEVELSIANKGASFVQFSGVLESLGGEATEASVYVKIWKASEAQPEDWTLLVSSLREGDSFRELIGDLASLTDYRYAIKVVNNLDDPYGFRVKSGSVRTSDGSADTWIDYETGYAWTYSVIANGREVEICNGELAAIVPSPVDEVTIPSMIGGMPVTSIGDYAFYECSSLAGVTIPESVVNIGYCAFRNCSSLLNVVIPAAVTNIELAAFSGCKVISSFSVADDNPVYQSVAGMILTRDGKMLVQGVNGDVTIPDGVEIVGPHSFRGCSTLTNVVFSGSVTNIASQAFYYCRGLTRVIIPGNVANIGAEAFMGCTSLGGVEIGDGVTSIGNLAFSRCSELRSVTIPSTMMSIGSSAFSSCNDELFDVAKISGVKLVDGWAVGYTSAAILSGTLNLKDVRGVADLAFSSCSRLTSVAIPSSLTYIGAGAFSGCARLQSFVVDPGNAAYKSESGLLLSKDGARLVAVPGALTRVVIPSDVTSIESYAFSGCSRLTSITLPVGLTDIGVSVFSGCSGLTSATIPDGVTSIGSSAFYGCSSLASVTIPAGVTSIGSSAFSGCSSLASVIIPTGVTSIGSSAFYGCSSLASVTIPAGVTSIGSSAFCGCSSLTSVAVPAGVTSIGDSAFSGCSSLASVTIPAGVTSIGSLAFSRCSSLTSAIIPAGVTSIGSSAFSGCSSLTSAIIPAGVTSIGSSAFSGCSRLTGMTIPDSVTSIGMYAFSGCSDSLFDRVTIPGVKLVNGWVVGYVFGIDDLHLRGARGIANSAFSSCSTLTSVTIPSNLTHIGDGAFSGCSKLQSFVVAPDNPAYKSESGLLLSKDGMRLVAIPGALTCIKIPSGVTAIQSRAFYNSFGLTSVEIPSDVISIGDFAFYACRSLKSLALPDSISVIGDSAFEACSSLTNITMSPNVTSIGRNAFYGCSYLTSIKIPSGVRSIGALTFFGCRSLTSIEIPAGVTGIGDRAFGGCQGVKSFIVAPENTTYKAIEGCLLSKDGKTLVVAPGGMESITIPDGVTSIGPYAFEGCYALSDVTIPDGVTSIGSYAFASCSALTNVAISASVTSIGAGAFSDCSSLERVTMPDGLAYIGDYVFRNCGALSSITIPDGVAGIGSEAFSGCTNLTSITIPRSVRAIGGSAFYGCHALGRVEFASFDTILCLDDMANMFPEGVEVTAEEVPAGLGFHCGEIVDDETWVSNEVHLVVGKVTVPSGVALTIETGAVVKFMSGASLIVSGSGNCTANGVVFTHVNDDTIGGDTLSDGGASVPKMDDYYASLPADCELTCEFRWRSVLHVTLAGTISADETWGGCNVYCVTGNLAVASGATLNIRPGAIVKFPSGVSLTINSGATLNAIGTRAQPIVFTSVKDDEYGGDTNGDGEDTYPWAGDWGCVRVSGGKIKADHCRFTYGGGVDGNQYGARACMFMWNGASGTFDNCLFGGSTMDGCFAQNATLRNCIFMDCDRGLVSSVGTITAINCVAAYNRIGFFAHQGSLVVYNSISSLNTESALTGDGGSRKDYNCYLGSDPKFVDPDNCDFRILEGSPCVDAAEAAYAPEMDYFGQPRVNAPDIGICEVIPRGVASDVDLAPQDVTATGPLAPGDEITVKWIVGNLGSRLVDVPWRDTVSLVSADGRAVTLGEKVSAMRIAAGGSVVCSGIFTVPALAEGVWYPKVQVNTYRDVFEGALTENNALMSVSPVELTIAAADVSAVVAGRIVAGVPTVLKLPFTEDAVNRLVRMTLPEGVTASWGFGFMPTTGRTGGSPVQSGGGISAGHDVCFLAPDGEQPVYVVLESASTADYSLAFEDNPLVISSISPTSIPKSGTTSITITGAGFTPSNTVSFTSASGAVAPESVRYVNANTLVATVDCGKFTSGATYAVGTSVGVLSTSLTDVLTITDEEGKGNLVISLLTPSSVRRGRICTCFVECENMGNLDVVFPVFYLEMKGDGFLRDVKDKVLREKLCLLGVGTSDNPSRILPGQKIRVAFEMLSGTSNGITLYSTYNKDFDPSPWNSCSEFISYMSNAIEFFSQAGILDFSYDVVRGYAESLYASVSNNIISGKVINSLGKPISQVPIELYQVNDDDNGTNEIRRVCRTLDNGWFQFVGMEDGKYHVAIPNGISVVSARNKTDSGTTNIVVSGGICRTDINFIIDDNPQIQVDIEGIAAEEEGLSVVLWEGKSKASVLKPRFDVETRAFVFNGLSTSVVYSLSVDMGRLSARKTLCLPSSGKRFEHIELSRNISISGTLTEASTSVIPDENIISIILHPINGVEEYTAEVNLESGTFVFENVPAGAYGISVSGSMYSYEIEDEYDFLDDSVITLNRISASEKLSFVIDGNCDGFIMITDCNGTMNVKEIVSGLHEIEFSHIKASRWFYSVVSTDGEYVLRGSVDIDEQGRQIQLGLSSSTPHHSSSSLLQMSSIQNHAILMSFLGDLWTRFRNAAAKWLENILGDYVMDLFETKEYKEARKLLDDALAYWNSTPPKKPESCACGYNDNQYKTDRGKWAKFSDVYREFSLQTSNCSNMKVIADSCHIVGDVSEFFMQKALDSYSGSMIKKWSRSITAIRNLKVRYKAIGGAAEGLLLFKDFDFDMVGDLSDDIVRGLKNGSNMASIYNKCYRLLDYLGDWYNGKRNYWSKASKEEAAVFESIQEILDYCSLCISLWKEAKEAGEDFAKFRNAQQSYKRNKQAFERAFSDYKQLAKSFNNYHNPQQCCKEPPEPPMPPEGTAKPDVPASKDPNEMAGPMGKGDPDTQRFVEPGQWLTYTVYYENDASATAAAQEVFVTNSLSQYLDWSTFEMGEVAFGDQIDLGLVGKQNCTNEVTMTGTNLIVRSIVDLDEEKGEVRWYMRVVDPDSGDTWPVDVTGGFLPPNDKETHCGEGHLTYRIKVRDDAPAGARIDNSAFIVFDTNEPIKTDPAWWNIIATHQDVSVTVDGVMTNLDLIVGVPYGELPTPKVRAGYTFGGWFTGPNGTGRRVTAQSLVEAGDNGLYALWLTHAYTVHFNANGGEGAMSDQAFAFDKADVLDANVFARRGYSFLGWATNETGAVVYEDEAEVSNLTSEDGGVVDLFAVWQLVSMKVTFDPNGGSLGTASATAVVTNGFAYGTLPTAVREGYSFVAWTSGRRADSPVVTAASIVTNAADHALYAQWRANSYTVVYEANGGEGEMEPLGGTYDLVSGLASNAFSRISHRFLGWATSADGPVVYVDGANVSNLTAAAGGTVTLYAVWELLTVEMAFDAQGGSPAPTNRVYFAEIPYGELPEVSREGYTFGGWYTGPNGTGRRVTAQGVAEFGSDGTLYANWLTNAYTVRFNANGGEGVMSAQAFVFDKPDALDSNAFVRANHDFIGWSMSADGESVYVDGEIVVNLTSAEGAVVDLFATWMRRIHAVDFYADEAMTRLVESRTVGEGISVGALPVTPASVDGYSFAGWRDMANPAAMVTADTIVAGDMKVCAVYTANTYTLFFDAAGGAVSTASKSVVFDEEIGRLPHSTRDGYTFEGWYVGNVKLTPTMVYETAGDSTATAHWTKDPDPEPEPEPEPEVVYELYSFVDGAAPVATASEYNGYLYDEKSGAVKGTIQVKVGKLGKKDGKASVKATVVLGAKKVTLKAKDKGKATIEKNGPTEIELVGGEACEIALGADGLAGYYGAYIIDGSRNFFASKDKGEVTVVNDILSKWLGSFMVVWDGGSLSVSIAAKGKVKVSGTLADGKTKVSVSTVLLVGEEWCCVSVAAQKANLAFVLWLSHDGQTIVAEGLGDNVLVGKAGALANGAVFHVDADEFASVFGQTMLPYLPDGVPVTQKGTKWTLPKAGKVVYKNGAVDESKLGENQCGLKLTYKAKDGTFKGSFKVYTEVKGKPKATTVNVTGFLLNGVGYGTATVKGKGSVTVTIE